jgi:hypothetical protein
MVRIDFDFRLFETRIEISSLHQALDIMENQVQTLIDQQTMQAQTDLDALAKRGVEWNDEEVHFVIQERDYAVEHLYPTLFRGPFLVMLWAIYEAGLHEVARFVKRHKNIDLDIDEIKGSNVQSTARRYFDAVLNVDFASDSIRSGELGKLYKVRNAFAHANGRISSLPSGVRKTVDSMIAEGHLEESFGCIAPTKAYVTMACEVVHAELTTLVNGAIAWHNEMQELTESGPATHPSDG